MALIAVRLKVVTTRRVNKFNQTKPSMVKKRELLGEVIVPSVVAMQARARC